MFPINWPLSIRCVFPIKWPSSGSTGCMFPIKWPLRIITWLGFILTKCSTWVWDLWWKLQGEKNKMWQRQMKPVKSSTRKDHELFLPLWRCGWAVGQGHCCFWFSLSRQAHPRGRQSFEPCWRMAFDNGEWGRDPGVSEVRLGGKQTSKKGLSWVYRTDRSNTGAASEPPSAAVLVCLCCLIALGDWFHLDKSWSDW